MTTTAAIAAPSGLSPAAQARWLAVAPTLAARGPIDAETLSTYCQVWARWREAEDKIASTSQLVKTPRGGVAASPLIAISNQAASQVRQLERTLGIDGGAAIVESAVTGTRAQLAAALGVDAGTILRWLRNYPDFPQPVNGRMRGQSSRWRLAEVATWKAAHDRTTSGNGGMAGLQAERAALLRAQREEAEQRIAIRARTLVDAREVERVWSEEQAAIKARLLALPMAYADRVVRAVAADGSDGAERMIQQMVDETLREFARGGGAPTRPRRATRTTPAPRPRRKGRR